MMHVDKLAERILFLTGEVEMKASHDVQKIHDVNKMLEMAAGRRSVCSVFYSPFI
jgi:bacterioferritin